MFIPRYIQLAIQAYLLSLLMVVCWPVDSKAVAFAYPVDQGQQRGTVANSRQYKLIHRCSSKYVQIYGKKIRTNQLDDYAVLTTQTYPTSVNDYNSTIHIRGKRSKAYLCFSKKGRLHTRYTFNKNFCTFQEILDEHHYTQFRQRQWRVGFNKSGRPLPGNSTNPRFAKCFQFMKKIVKDSMSNSSNENGESGVSVVTEAHRRRHSSRKHSPHPHRHRGGVGESGIPTR